MARRELIFAIVKVNYLPNNNKNEPSTGLVLLSGESEINSQFFLFTTILPMNNLKLGLDEASPYLKTGQQIAEPVAAGFESVLAEGGHVLVLVLPKAMVDTTARGDSPRGLAWRRAVSHIWDNSHFGKDPKWCLVPRVIAQI